MNKPEIVVGQSPSSKTETPKHLTFLKAMECVINGCQVHKLEWKDAQFFVARQDGFLMLHKPDGKFYQWVISDGDMIGEDYIVTKAPKA